MRNKIVSFTKFINHEREEGSTYGTFHMEKNIQFIDINNLNQYTKKELTYIAHGYSKYFSGAGWTKDKIINLILSDKKVVNDMKKNNREIMLNQLVG